jgi:hypothetical protein
MDLHEQATKAAQSAAMLEADLRAMFGHTDQMTFLTLCRLAADAATLRDHLEQFTSALKDRGDEDNGRTSQT